MQWDLCSARVVSTEHLEELLPRVMLLLLSSSQNQLTILDHHLTRVLLLHEAQACRNSTCHI